MSKYPTLMPDGMLQQMLLSPIGRGGARETYRVTGDPAVVIKKVHLSSPAANFLEWQLWNAVAKTDLKATFGRCVAISETGRFLMMEYLDDISEEDYAVVPDVPVWFNDRKPSAFGKTKNGIVKIRDYATVNLELVLDVNIEPVAFAIRAKIEASKI